MRQLKDMPTLEFTDMRVLETIDKNAPVMEDMMVCKPVYQQWGFWILLAACIMISFAGGVMIRTGGSLFG